MIKLRLVSLFGLAVILMLGWSAGRNRNHTNYRLIVAGVLLQLVIGALVFKLPASVTFFSWMNTAVLGLLAFSKEGMNFLFGPLAVSPGETGPSGQGSLGFILAFQVLPTIIFFSSLMSLLDYVKVLPILVQWFARIFCRFMGISGAEALSCSSNIFVGIESALTIRPHIEHMTQSELCTVITVGMSTIASSVLALYVGFLHKEFPAIAGHLIAASFMAAPAGIVMAKLVVPETQLPRTMGTHLKMDRDPRAKSWIESIILGANDGVKLCVGIAALLVAFLGLLAMCNWGLEFLGMTVAGVKLSLQTLLSWAYYPMTLLMGIPFEDAPNVALLLGERTIVTEVVSYQHLAQMIQNHIITNERSVIITSYALCGFAHVASLAIFVGGFAALAPTRSKDLAGLGFRALYAATLACLMTGCIAGVFA